MSKPDFKARRKMGLEAFREQALEAQGLIASIELDMPDGGESFVIPHPLTVDDETQARLEAVQTGKDLDKDEDGTFKYPLSIDGVEAEPLPIRTAKALLGDEKHAEFLRRGGHSNDVNLAWNWMAEEQKKALESDPK